MAKRYGMFIDLDRCIGCHTCAIACKVENGTPLGVSWQRVLTVGGVHLDTPRGTYPDLSMYWLPVPCMHCQNPPCERACPRAAISRREDGLVLVDRGRCDGCKDCLISCPYGALRYNHSTAEVEKCTLCAHRLDAGREPFCVEACSWQAIVFGDLNDPDSAVSQAIVRKCGQVLLQEQGTNPSVYYSKASGETLPALASDLFVQDPA